MPHEVREGDEAREQGLATVIELLKESKFWVVSTIDQHGAITAAVSNGVSVDRRDWQGVMEAVNDIGLKWARGE